MVSDTPFRKWRDIFFGGGGGLGVSIHALRCFSSMYLFPPSDLHITRKET